MKILGVIPARYASTRFPGKPLVDIRGKSMIQRVYEQASKSSKLDEVWVATDDERIESHVRGFGGNVIMTSASHPTGTDRVLEVVEAKPEFDAYVNIQGDEPFIDPQQIDLVCGILESQEGAFVATLVRKLDDLSELDNPNTIKVVLADRGKALYFSRAAIPFVRSGDRSAWHSQSGFLKHIGIYGYSKQALTAIRRMNLGNLEAAESLEQLRWMENGIPIFTAETHLEGHSVDVPEDLDKLPA